MGETGPPYGRIDKAYCVAGGFVRIAIVNAVDKDDAEAFDHAVVKYACFESGCHSGDIRTPNGADGTQNTTCSTTLRIPPSLVDSDVIMQFSWFGGGFVEGDAYSCLRLQLSGPHENTPLVPVFEGGDTHNHNDHQCAYFTSNRLGVCRRSPCLNGGSYGTRRGQPALWSESMQQWQLETHSNREETELDPLVYDHGWEPVSERKCSSTDTGIVCLQECCGTILLCHAEGTRRIQLQQGVVCRNNALFSIANSGCGFDACSACIHSKTGTRCSPFYPHLAYFCQDHHLSGPSNLSPGLLCTEDVVHT